MPWEMVCTCSMAMKLREAHMVESSSTPKVSPLIAIWTLYQAVPPGLLHSRCSPRMWQMTGLGIQFGPSGCGRLVLLSDACMAISFVLTTQIQIGLCQDSMLNCLQAPLQSRYAAFN